MVATRRRVAAHFRIVPIRPIRLGSGLEYGRTTSAVGSRVKVAAGGVGVGPTALDPTAGRTPTAGRLAERVRRRVGAPVGPAGGRATAVAPGSRPMPPADRADPEGRAARAGPEIPKGPAILQSRAYGIRVAISERRLAQGIAEDRAAAAVPMV